MIWFRCKQCGKHHGRAESLSGTLVFCECGHGNRVPWESTAEEPEGPPQEVPAAPAPAEAAEEVPPPPPPPPPPRRAPRPPRRRNPAYCLNHDEAASEKKCDACREMFCAACVVALRGRTLCGPCKNFFVRSLDRPPRVSALALVAVAVGLISGPVTLCLSFAGIGQLASGEGSVGLTVFVSLASLLLPAAGLVLSGLALREVETQPRVGGRWLAMTAAAASLVGVLWTVTVAGLLAFKQWPG
jgi:hypothetical protein